MEHPASLNTEIPQSPTSEWRKSAVSRHGRVQVTKNAKKVLEKRYLKRAPEGKPIETPEDMVCRVAWNIALAEGKYFVDDTLDAVSKAADQFYRIIAHLYFLPNSPTLMNAGRDLQQLSACFVLPVHDSISGIFDAVKYTALIHKSGGGTGFSFSNLRPANDTVKSTHGVSSGPISFMGVFDHATETIKQGGTRRGANMGMLRVDHPDILEFITCKEDKSRLTNFNISVAITEEFEHALETGGEYELKNPRTGEIVKKLDARFVYGLIVDSAWRNGEPGIVFIDRVNHDNPTPHVGNMEATNPCGEQPLLPYESCNLGSINLARLVVEDKGNKALDFELLREVVHSAVHFLDNVIDMNNYPLLEISEMTLSNRKIGLGVMGFADMLIQLGIPYGSEKSLEIAREIMSFIQEESKNASVELAKTRGVFPNFKGSEYDKRGIRVRNATTTTIAPTGTISIIAGVSSGIEPVYALVYIRNVMDNDHLPEGHPLFETEAKARGLYSKKLMEQVRQEGSLKNVDGIPADMKAIYQVAHDIPPEGHIRMQAAFQEYVDNAVSKTVNFPHDATKDDIRKVFDLANDLSCKGVTVYRDKSRDSQVLNIGKVNDGKELSDLPARQRTPGELLPRPGVLLGLTKEVGTGCGKLYVTINSSKEGVFEVFNQMGKAGGCGASQLEAIGRLASIALRAGVKSDIIIKQLKGIQCHKSAGFGDRAIRSCSDGVAQALEWYLLNAAPHFSGIATEAVEAGISGEPVMGKKSFTEVLQIRGACPDCGGQLEPGEGCAKCIACGYSECG